MLTTYNNLFNLKGIKGRKEDLTKLTEQIDLDYQIIHETITERVYQFKKIIKKKILLNQ